jgi:hypothetical protein
MRKSNDGDNGESWMAFGFDAPLGDGGSASNFYFVEGRSNGGGGAYHVDTNSGDIEGWIAVADKGSPNTSQVLIHLLLHKDSGSVELTLAGSGVGFCSAHLKTTADALFIVGNTIGPIPEGETIPAGTEYCQPARMGCFNPTSLTTELDADDSACEAVNSDSFAIATDLDGTPTGNVVASTIHKYLSTAPKGIPSL